MASTISVDDAAVFAALRAFIVTVIGGGGTAPEVVRAFDNGVPMPDAPFICMRQGAIKPIEWPRASYDPANNLRNYIAPKQYTIQVDCYGPESRKWADIIHTLIYTDYGYTQMGNVVKPLYGEDPQQMPLVNGEYQFEQRWRFNVNLQYNPVISTPQDFMQEAVVDVINVDVVYPPV